MADKKREPEEFSCPNSQCSNHGKFGEGNISWDGSYPTSGGKAGQLKCKICGMHFSEKMGTPFYRLKTEEATFIKVLVLLVQGASLRRVSKETGVKTDTISRWLKTCAVQRKPFIEELERLKPINSRIISLIDDYLKDLALLLDVNEMNLRAGGFNLLRKKYALKSKES